ncbi:MAG: hypothetical protein ABI442_06780 [Gemmatimonadaceae bacterium]
MTAFREHQHSLAAPRRTVAGLCVFTAVMLGACQGSSAPAPAPQPTRGEPGPVAITSGPALLRAIHDRYASTWYHTLTFTQKTTLSLASGGEMVQTWYEAGEIPGKLRIDTDLGSKGGVLYARDSTYSFANGKLVKADSGMNELLVLGFDIYSQPVARSETILRHLGFDLSKIHEATWQGEPVYVVGAERGDTVSRQFWATRDNLLFVRELTHTRAGRAEFRFNKYVRSNGGWVASEVEQIINGKRRVLEEYSNIRTNVPLSQGLLDPKQWSTAPHWFKP